MEAKDTVIRSVEEINGTTFLPADYISWREHQNLMEKQAVISFQAGMKKVADWVEIEGSVLDYETWRAQLKKWEIDD